MFSVTASCILKGWRSPLLLLCQLWQLLSLAQFPLHVFRGGLGRLGKLAMYDFSGNTMEYLK